MFRIHTPRQLALWMLLPALGLAACSGGGGGSVNPTTGGNEGSYSPDDFTYVDPHPAGFHPLGTTGRVVNARAEQLVVLPWRTHHPSEVWINESASEGFDEVPATQDLFGENAPVRGAASGQFDDDAAQEWIGAHISHNESRVTLTIVDRASDGSVTTQDLLSFDPGNYSLQDARVELADLDADGLDEIIVIARAGMFGHASDNAAIAVYDDPLHGAAQLLYHPRNGRHVDIWAHPADVDGDGRPEVVVSLAGDTTSDARHAVRLFALAEGAPTMHSVHSWHYVGDGNTTKNSKTTVGDFDGDGKDELVLGKTSSFAGLLGVVLFEWNSQMQVVTRPYSTIGDVDEPGTTFWAITAFDRRGGQDEVAVIAKRGYGSSNKPIWITTLRFDPVGETWSQEHHNLGHPYSGQRVALCAGDMNADGSEELQWGLLRGLGTGNLWRGYLSGSTWETLPTITTAASLSHSRPPVLVSGDWDADGLVVEYTGRKFLQMERPIPLTVLSAPPTKSGISQNYEDSGTHYETGTEQGTSWGVMNGTTITASLGTELNIFGLFKAGGKATIERVLQTTQTETTRETTVRGYTGSVAADTIIFEGVLQQAYEYVIVEAPDQDAIGQYITLNVPVDSRTYNWTVDYFNTQVGPEDQIGADILTHTPGVIESYPTFTEIESMTAGQVQWRSDSEIDVGQGPNTTYEQVNFATESATETQRTLSIGGEGSLAVGLGATAGATADSGTIYTVTYAQHTEFGAEVGGLLDPADYVRWKYRWGMLVQTVGRQADANNDPTGYSPDRRPFQLVRYWVTRVGTGY